jgi:lipopolysaccharide export system permease protein
MYRIDRMVLRAFIGPFVMSVAIILFILVLQFVSLYMSEIMGKGLSLDTLGKLFFYASGRVLLTAMPIGTLTAGLMTFGSLGEHYELAALKSSGVNLFKIMRSSVVFGVMVMLGSLWLAFEVIPQSNLKFFSLLYDVQRKKANLALRPGHFYTDIDDYVIRIADKDIDRGMLYDVLIYDHSENRGNNDIIMADSARMDLWGNVMRMKLYSGSRYEDYKPEKDEPERRPHGRIFFDSLYYRFELEGFDLDRTDESQFRHQIIMRQEQLEQAIDSLSGVQLNTRRKSEQQLARYNKIDSAFVSYGVDTTEQATHGQDDYLWVVLSFELAPGDDPLVCIPQSQRADVLNRAISNVQAVQSYAEFMSRKYEERDRVSSGYLYELYSRWAMSINCLVFTLIGIALGAIIRKGGLGPPALVSITMFLLFYIMTTYGKKLSKEDILDPWVGAFLPVMIFAPVAVYFTYQAAMDARLFNESTWGMWRDMLMNLFLRKRRASPSPEVGPPKGGEASGD